MKSVLNLINPLAFSKRITYNQADFAGGRNINPTNPTSPLIELKYQTANFV